MAELLGAELMGIFVEDINLLHVAQLSFVNEIRYPMVEVRKFDQPKWEQHWQAQAAPCTVWLAAVAAVNKFHIRLRSCVVLSLPNCYTRRRDRFIGIRSPGKFITRPFAPGFDAQTAVSQARGSGFELMGGD